MDNIPEPLSGSRRRGVRPIVGGRLELPRPVTYRRPLQPGRRVPLAVRRPPQGGEALHGRAAVEAYAAAALARYPDLHFGPEITVATGAGSIVLAYRSVDDLLAVETLVLDEAGLVGRAHCHYRSAAPGEPTVAAAEEGS